MNLYFLNSNFEIVGVIDVYDSLLWIDRYSEYGEFEIVSSINSNLISFLQTSLYVTNKETERVMIIEDFEIKSDQEFGDKIYIKGRSIESILERRTIYTPINMIGNLETQVENLLNSTLINPDDENRKISNFTFQYSSDLSIISMDLEDQFSSSDLYTILRDISFKKGIGFILTLNIDKSLTFYFYNGIDRSYDQYHNPYVVFSPNYDNLVRSNYFASTKFLKTVAYVSGEDDGVNPIHVVEVPSDGEVGGTGFNRRELYIDASDIRRVVDEVELNDEEYDMLLYQRGLEELSKNTSLESFDAEANPDGVYKYGTDFWLGDILQVANEYGKESRSRITEVIISKDSSGMKIVPTFVTIT